MQKSIIRLSVCPENLDFSIARMNALFTRGTFETMELIEKNELLNAPYISIFENFDIANISIYRSHFQYQEALYMLYSQREARFLWTNIMVRYYKLRNFALKNRLQNYNESWAMLGRAVYEELGDSKWKAYNRMLNAVSEKLDMVYHQYLNIAKEA